MRSRWVAGLEAAAVATFFALAAVLAVRLGEGVRGWSDGPVLLLAALAGYALADAASGVTHWFCDSFFKETTPCIGPLLLQPFREHHRDPSAMTRHGFLELTGNSCLGTAPVLAAAAWGAWPPWVYAGLLSFALAIFATNTFHKWAHSPEVPGWVARLQRCRLILSPAVHAVHHRPPHRGAYGVTNGWMNPILNRVLRWPALPDGDDDAPRRGAVAVLPKVDALPGAERGPAAGDREGQAHLR